MPRPRAALRAPVANSSAVAFTAAPPSSKVAILRPSNQVRARRWWPPLSCGVPVHQLSGRLSNRLAPYRLAKRPAPRLSPCAPCSRAVPAV
eukprot:14057106-Alexandrium_andersonii.AAC.1